MYLHKSVKVTFDPAKRERNLSERGLDFADAARVFNGQELSVEDNRFDYGETRIITLGRLGTRQVRVVWTQRGGSRRVISMRYCRDNEAKRFREAANRAASGMEGAEEVSSSSEGSGRDESS